MQHHLIHAINSGCLSEGLRLLPLKYDSLRARAQLLKTGLQESKLTHRIQLIEKNGKMVACGPAVSFWQFERSGIRGVLRHPATAELARQVCRARKVEATADAIHTAMKTDDALGAAFARLNLYWHVKPLPEIYDLWGSWAYYLDCWNPGKPHPKTWPGHQEAVLAYLKDRG